MSNGGPSDDLSAALLRGAALSSLEYAVHDLQCDSSMVAELAFDWVAAIDGSFDDRLRPLAVGIEPVLQGAHRQNRKLTTAESLRVLKQVEQFSLRLLGFHGPAISDKLVWWCIRLLGLSSSTPREPERVGPFIQRDRETSQQWHFRVIQEVEEFFASRRSPNGRKPVDGGSKDFQAVEWLYKNRVLDYSKRQIAIQSGCGRSTVQKGIQRAEDLLKRAGS